MISTSDFRNGISIVYEGQLYQMVEFQHFKPGKGGAFVRTKLKNMRTKAVIDRTFRAGEKVEDAYIEYKKLQYMYNSGDRYFFMDTHTYEETSLEADILEDKRKFLKEGMEIQASYHDHRIVDLNLPIFIELKVEHTEPGAKGDTAKAAYKPATLETGVVVQVPLFIETGNTLRIDTRTGEYVERA